MSTTSRAFLRSGIAQAACLLIPAALVGACSHDWALLEVTGATAGPSSSGSGSASGGSGSGGGDGGAGPSDAGSDAPCSDDLSSDPNNCGTCKNVCESGQCAAGQCVPKIDEDAGPCSPDLTTDMANCGTCGHDCQGGACVDSECQPVTLTAGQGSPVGMAIDSTTIYWTDYSAGQILSMPISGGPISVLASGQQKPAHIQVMGGQLYWANGGQGAAGGTIVNLNLASLGTGTLVSNLENLVGIDVTPTTIYFTSQINPNGVVYKAPIGGGAPTVLGSGFAFPEDIVLDGNRIFVAELFGGRISTLPVAGGADALFVSQGGDPAGVAIDATTLYFTTQVGDTVYAMSKDGGAPVVIANGQDGATGIAVNATTVFWTNFYAGTVMKMAKPILPF